MLRKYHSNHIQVQKLLSGASSEQGSGRKIGESTSYTMGRQNLTPPVPPGPKIAMTSKGIMSTSTSFATKVAAAPVAAPIHAIPTGSWTIYVHEPDDKSWTSDSYKRISPITSWEMLGSVIRELGTHRITNGMMFGMRGDTFIKAFGPSNCASNGIPLI